MLHLILMNHTEQANSLYKGAICIMDGKPWYVTGVEHPTIFKDEKKANEMVGKLKEANGDKDFLAVSVDFYLMLIGKELDRWNCKWINQLRQEQLEL